MGFLENELEYNVNIALWRQCTCLKEQIYRLLNQQLSNFINYKEDSTPIFL